MLTGLDRFFSIQFLEINLCHVKNRRSSPFQLFVPVSCKCLRLLPCCQPCTPPSTRDCSFTQSGWCEKSCEWVGAFAQVGCGAWVNHTGCTTAFDKRMHWRHVQQVQGSRLKGSHNWKQTHTQNYIICFVFSRDFLQKIRRTMKNSIYWARDVVTHGPLPLSLGTFCIFLPLFRGCSMARWWRLKRKLVDCCGRLGLGMWGGGGDGLLLWTSNGQSHRFCGESPP